MGNKALVVVAAQPDRKGIGRIRLRRVADASSRSLHAFVQEAIVPGATVITDGWEGYEGLNALGYLHRARVISGSGKTASILLPRVHRVASLLKRWLLGTHQVLSPASIWIITSTSSRSDSTDASPAAGPNSSIDWFSRPWLRLQCGMKVWFGETAAKPQPVEVT